MDLRRIDLNLLVSLDALLAELNVTRAAQRLHVSQPALSAQLARLRQVFNDPLLIPAETGRGMAATARALELRAPLHALLKEMENLLRSKPGFDPARDEHTFSIAASDNTTMALGVPIAEMLRREAGPGIRVAFRNHDLRRSSEQLESGEVDFLFVSDSSLLPSMKAVSLLSERFVMIQRKRHPRGTVPLTLESYCELQHVLVSPTGGSFHGFIDEHLEPLGMRRKVVLSIQQFILAPAIVQVTDYVCTLPSRLAARHRDKLDIFELPFETSGFTVFLGWHPRNHADPAHKWMRELIQRSVAVAIPPAFHAS